MLSGNSRQPQLKSPAYQMPHRTSIAKGKRGAFTEDWPMGLIAYVQDNAVRGQCRCGRCLDGGEEQPSGHTADVYFFEVALVEGADKDVLRKLVESHRGEFAECNLFDGKEHSYIEVGAWIGDQGLALILIGMGFLLGLWRLVTPKMLPGLPKELMDQMAGQGMVSIIAKPED